MKPKSERVYADLRRRILDGEFRDGHRLVLSRIAEAHDVSPVPVREALRRLEAQGLVRFIPNVGAEVVGVDSADYSETMEALAYLEGAVTSLAAPRLGAEALARAREVNEQMRALRAGDIDPVEFTALNQSFHAILCEPCPNQHLKDLLHRDWERMSHIRRSTFLYVPDRSHTSVQEHDELLDLLAGGAPSDEVEQAARRHKLLTLEQFLASEAQSGDPA